MVFYLFPAWLFESLADVRVVIEVVIGVAILVGVVLFVLWRCSAVV